MQPKKNPKADLAKSSGLFFAIGFAIVSGLTLWGFEAKVYDKGAQGGRESSVDKVLDESQENFVMEAPDTPPPPPPPPPPAVVEEVEVVDNKADVKDTNFAGNETTKEEKVAQVADIKTPEPVSEPEIDVPFTIIEDKPMFEACKNQPKDKQFQCFKENLDKHVSKNFVYPPAALEMGIQGKVNVSFRINTDGSITVLGVRGTDKLLEAEARRIIEKLPKLIPGKQRGKPTPVTFAYPINFKLQS
ncbi:MAG: energy transducer TonB [Capnocytophaga sp.]|uniref:energy transducer TonB n=1 Tax=Capnocytophaga sp. TaxID=44737 RepID=UPI003F9F7B93